MQISKEDADKWWDNADYETRQLAFYSVIDRMRQSELLDKGSYKFAIYDTFGFKGDMYGPGIECGYMDLHNQIADIFEQDGSGDVKVIQIVDPAGGDYEKQLIPERQVALASFQDNGQLLKIVIQPTDPV